MAKTIKLIIFLLLINIFSLYGISVPQNSLSGKEALQLIQRLPQACQLISSIEKEGPVKIEILSLPHENFDAFWEGGRRTIRINAERNGTLGILICSILFELHNAATNRHLKKLTLLASTGMISKEEYVEAIERLEHENALKTCALLNEGIFLNIFPAEAYWPILPHFEDHYKIQQVEGHSAWIAAQYDSLSPHQHLYIGTLPPNMTRQQKKDLLQYLRIKHQVIQEIH